MITRNEKGQFIKGFISPRKNGSNLVCPTCNKSFYVPLHRIKTALFCSRKCKALPKKGKPFFDCTGTPSWNKGLIGYHAGKECHLWKGGKKTVKCLTCSREFLYWPCEDKRLYCSKKCSNINNIRVGKDNNMWKGGITPENRKIRTSTKYKEWRKAVFERDNYICVSCGEKGYLNADHIKRFADYPDLRFELTNGRTLCTPCHRQTETYGGYKILNT